MTKQLFVLAAWAVFATAMMGLAGSWHTESYSVAQPVAAPESLAGVVTATNTVGGSGIRSQSTAVTP